MTLSKVINNALKKQAKNIDHLSMRKQGSWACNDQVGRIYQREKFWLNRIKEEKM